MSVDTQQKVSSTSSSTFPSSSHTSFPDNVPTAPLVTISLPRLLSSDHEEQSKLYEASKGLGFFYLDMRGSKVGEAIRSDANTLFGVAEDFFNLPLEDKKQFDFAAQGSYYGYKGMGAEVIDGKGTKDRNEIYNIPKDDILSTKPTIPAPDLITSQRDLLNHYVHASDTILQTLFSSLSSSLGLPQSSSLSTLHRLNEPSGCHIRFIRAPPSQALSPSPSTPALGEHTDFGSLTLLFNRIGGLQVLLPNTSEWVYVRPLPGRAIINLGDAMVKFSGGLLRSNLHRVVRPPGSQVDMERYSLVYFCRPEHAVVMRRLKGTQIAEGGEDDEGVSTQEWLKRRHLGRKVQYFKGEESWEGAKGTEARL